MTITATATFCATLVDQWALMGSTDAFIAPGSRSTPLALALVADDRVRVHLFHDERSASFACLGHGLATGRPAVLLCTSGTAATHFHGAVVEADASGVPMLVCTADRPPELWGVGAPQTIDQTDLYGEAVRGFLEPGPPDEPGTMPSSWRPMAADAWNAATGAGPGSSERPGPVHLNLSFRDPLVGEAGPLPAVIATGADEPEFVPDPSSTTEPDPVMSPTELPARGVLVVGRSTGDPDLVFALAEATGWPVLADARSRCRRPGASVSRFDHLLRSAPFAAAVRPDLVVRIGEPPASKVLGQWIAAAAAEGADVIALTDGARLIDPERVASAVLDVAVALPELVAATNGRPRPEVPFSRQWLEAEAAVESAIVELLDREPGGSDSTEPGIARSVSESLAPGSALVVSSSMPVRDLEWYGVARSDVDVFANRGANGIDGVTSTAIGIALTGQPTALLIGDVAFLHDTNGLIGLDRRRSGNDSIDLTIVVVDNDGGGIFSFLPQHEVLPHDDYELLFGTPHGSDLALLCAAHGLQPEAWDPTGLGRPGVRVLIAQTDRARNLDLHDRLVAAGRQAAEATLA